MKRTSELVLLDKCHATDSSGCHRYDYWIEQALFNGNARTGWCTPSRTTLQLKFIEIDLGGRHRPNLLRIQARPISEWPGSPRSIRALVNDGADGHWVGVFDAKNVEVAEGRGGAQRIYHLQPLIAPSGGLRHGCGRYRGSRWGTRSGPEQDRNRPAALKIVQACAESGLLLCMPPPKYGGSLIKIMPPLVTSPDEMRRGLELFAEAVFNQEQETIS